MEPLKFILAPKLMLSLEGKQCWFLVKFDHLLEVILSRFLLYFKDSSKLTTWHLHIMGWIQTKKTELGSH